ncbi:MAG: arsenate reductase family protein [Clostridiales bacterium]|nr:arsenate reductase family protein [Clostridiales bacterium]
MLVLCYPRCGTCKKALKWLEDNGLEYEYRHIVENNPTRDELKDWYERSGLPLKKFFNTSGLKYKELNLKDRIPEMTEDEIFDLLSTDGMLVKRPILIEGDKVLVGFKVEEWETLRK